MCTPGIFAIIVSSVAVVGALILGCYSVSFALSRQNPLWWLCAGGSAIFVLGMIGQRAYYLSPAQAAGGCSKTVSGHPGIWDASITLPLSSVSLDLVALVGVFATLLGGCLMLFFEKVGVTDVDRPAGHRAEERDRV